MFNLTTEQLTDRDEANDPLSTTHRPLFGLLVGRMSASKPVERGIGFQPVIY